MSSKIERSTSIERSTAGLREVVFREIELLTDNKISAQRAAVTAKLVSAAIASATLEMQHARHFQSRDGKAACVPAIAFGG